jgi:hypothetical protein
MKRPWKQRKNVKNDAQQKGVLLFNTVREGIQAEHILLNNGYSVRKVGPPPQYRKGCEIAVEIDLSSKDEIVHILNQAHIEPQGIIPLP